MERSIAMGNGGGRYKDGGTGWELNDDLPIP